MSTFEINEQYVTSSPSPQNALDIFRGEWSSRLPSPLDALNAGAALLFDDPRITWMLEKTGGCQGLQVLELGPLEAGHSYMLEKAGSAQVVSVESNTHAFLKCLIVKELLGLSKVKFLCGDFVSYLRDAEHKFDLCIASGVLYHMMNPVELIALLASRCSKHVFFWTHYYNSDVIHGDPVLTKKFPSEEAAEHQGFKHALHRYEYLDALGWGGFCGGSTHYSHWMSRDDILRCINYFGFSNVEIGFDEPNHPNGPSFAVLASR